MSTDPLNLDEYEPWLALCGSCVAGLPMSCTCLPGDHRAVIRRLIEEIERLRADQRTGHCTATPEQKPVELTWEDVWAAIGREVWKLAPQEYQNSRHRDIAFPVCWQNIMEAVHSGIVEVADLADEVQP
jgi:hypothetical protein